jgi:hypothetical protein
MPSILLRLQERVSGVGKSVEDCGGDSVALSGAAVGELTREIDARPKAGGGHVTVVTTGLGLDSVNGHIDCLDSLASTLRSA